MTTLINCPATQPITANIAAIAVATRTPNNGSLTIAPGHHQKGYKKQHTKHCQIERHDSDLARRRGVDHGNVLPRRGQRAVRIQRLAIERGRCRDRHRPVGRVGDRGRQGGSAYCHNASV